MKHIRKVNLLLILLMIITLTFACVIISNQREEVSSLRNIISDYDITKNENSRLREQLDEFIKKSEILENKINESNKEKEELQNNYKDINEKYQKEIAPMSFNPNNLKEGSGSTFNKIKKILKGTGLQGLESAYYNAEKTYGVNALFLIALTAEESAWGQSKRAKEQNNMSGFAVYNNSSKGASFNSKSESIMSTAKLVSEEYLDVDGDYYNGISIYDVNKLYCPTGGNSWSHNIKTIAYELKNKTL